MGKNRQLQPEQLNIVTEKGGWFNESPRMKTSEWLTPPWLLSQLGPFDLDPCSPIQRPWPTAAKHYTINDNGLLQPWEGRVWCNPPYGTESAKWLAKLAKHGDGVALVFARTETRTFFDWIWDRADAILFIKGRLAFYDVNGKVAKWTAGGPSCLVAYGLYNAEVLHICEISGKYIKLK